MNALVAGLAIAGVGLTELLRRPNSVDASLLAQIADAVDAIPCSVLRSYPVAPSGHMVAG